MNRIIISLFLFVSFSSPIFSQLNTELLAQLEYSVDLSDVWGYTADDGTEYALVGLRNGLSIVSLDDPENPVEVDFIGGDNSIWRDIKTYDHYAYVIADQGNDGMLVVDLENLPNSVSSQYWRPTIPGQGTLNRCHNLYIDDSGYVYLTGCNLNGGAAMFIDVFTDSWNPSYVDALNAPYAHDVFVRDDLLFASEINAGQLSIYDVSNKSNSFLLGSQNTPNNFTHNAWSNDDNTVVYTTDEKSNAKTASYDITDPTNIDALDEFRPLATINTGVIPHNVHVRDDYLIISHYTDGVVVVDATDASNLIEVGDYDTWTGAGQGFNGTWGAFPYFDSDIILASDIDNGLFVLQATYTRSARIEGVVTDFVTGNPINQADIEIISSQLNATTSNASGVYKTGQEMEGVFDVVYSKTGYVSQTHQIALRKGESVIKDVQLVPISAAVDLSGNVSEFFSGDDINGAALVIENDDFRFEAFSNANGDYTFLNIAEGTYTLLAGKWGYEHNSKSVTVNGNTSNEDITLKIGYEDDFFGNLGWSETGVSGEGKWERGDPFGTEDSGTQLAPEDDLTDDLGNEAFVTGNRGVNSDDDDVDNGDVILESPFMDLTIYNQPILEFYRWVYNDGNDPLEITIDNGLEEQVLSTNFSTNNEWVLEDYDLNDIIPASDNMVFTVMMGDGGNDDIVEAGIDGFYISEGTPFLPFTINDTEGCIPFVTTFNDVNNNTVSWDWTFEGGSPSTSNLKNPTVTYVAPGVYDVTLTVETYNGDLHTHTIPAAIIVQETPSIGFSFSVDESTVTFNNNSEDHDSSFWTFGDGNSSNDENPIHTYAEDGDYVVTLEVTNACGTASISEVVNIITLPVASFGSDVTTGCEGAVVNYLDFSSSNTDDWEWTFPGGAPSSSNAQNPQITYNSTGTYAATLIVTNDIGSDTLEQLNYITIDPSAVADFEATESGLLVAFENLSVDATTFNWDFGDGNNSMAENPIHTYATDGTYDVQLIATNNCGSDTITITVNASSLPTANFDVANNTICIEDQIDFINLSSSNADEFIWEFEGGSPATSDDVNPIVTYNSPGVYDVTLTAINDLGEDVIMQQNYITVLDTPTAQFGFSADELILSFNDLSQDAISYMWNFGDGNDSNDPSPTHEYDADGIYTITLTVTNTCGTDMMVQNIEVISSPLAGFSADNDAICEGESVKFSNLSSDNSDDFLWSFEGGSPTTSSAANPTVLYDNRGTYTVQLIVSNEVGSDTLEMEQLIEVDYISEASFSSSENGLEISLENESQNYDQLEWSLGDGSEFNQMENLTYEFNEEGIYVIQLIASNQCGSDTMTRSFTAGVPAIAGFSSNATSGCSPQSIIFENLSTDNVQNFEWSFVGGNPSTSNDENPVVEYSSKGTYDVQLIVESLLGLDTLVLENYISIADVPVTNFVSNSNDLEFNFANTSEDALDYFWKFGDGNTSMNENPNHNYATEGQYQVTLITSNACGLDSLVKTVNATTLPQAGFAQSVVEGCIPFDVQYTSLSSGNTIDWQWTFEGGNPATSSEENPSVSYESAGEFGVELIAFSSSGSDTLESITAILAIEGPLAEFQFEADLLSVVFENQSLRGDSYMWEFGDGETSIEENPTHEYTEPGSYQVSLSVTNECGTVTISYEVFVEASSIFFDEEEITSIDVYPNPFVNRVFIDYQFKNVKSKQLELISSTGQKLKSIQIDDASGKLEVEHEFQAGMYLLRIISEGQLIWTKKIIKLGK